MKKNVLALSILLLVSSFAFAHGEDKPGPHGGFVRMPGAFHTEIAPDSDTEFKMYLLDINWKNPSVKDSTIDIQFIDKSTKIAVQCQQGINFFQCQLAKGHTLKKGKLIVKASREKAVGSEVTYNLPLSFDSEDEHGSHEGHH